MRTTHILLTLAFIYSFSSISVRAQENESMKFMGIPISGNINEFSKKLQAKGFVEFPNNEETVTLTGKFTNKDVVIALAKIDGTNDIYRVGVFYEPVESWSSLENHQNYLIDLFTKKYGEPESSTRITEPIYQERGNFIFYGFDSGKVEYSDFWQLSNGSIQIQITPNNNSSASLMIIYEDSASADTLEKEILDDI